MKYKIEIENNNFKSYLYYTIIYLLIIHINSFQNFKAFTLLSNDIVLITDAGIIKYNPSTYTQTVINQNNIISSQNDQDYISFIQFPENEGGYAICRLKNTIFVYNNNLDNLFGSFEISEIENFYCDMKSYKTIDGRITIIISYINGDQKLRIIMYKMNIGQTDNFGELIHEVTRPIKNKFEQEMNALNKAISCELIVKSNYNNKLLVCFAAEQQFYSLIVSAFDPENSLSFLFFSDNLVETSGTSIIKSVISPNKKNSFICLVDSNGYLNCFVYNSETNKLSDKIIFFNGCQHYSFNTDVRYISETNEYSANCYTNDIHMNFIKFDENLNIKDIDQENDRCYYNFQVSNEQCYSVYYSYLLYIKSDNKYIMLRNCDINNNNYELKLLTISQTCNTKIEQTGFNIENEIIPTTLPISTTQFLSHIITTIPIPLTTIFETEKESTILTTIPDFLLISTLIQTTIISNLPLSPPTTIISTLPLFPPTTIPETSIIIKESPLPNLTPETTIIITESPSTVVILTNFPIISESSIILISTLPYFPKEILTTLISSYTSQNEKNEDSNNKSIQFHIDGDIMKGKINKTKEEIENNLEEIIEIIEIGKKYEINGNNYNITITPINNKDSFKSAFVDMTKCEDILRKEYNMTKAEILTILQIEIDKMNEKALTNQIEYEVYNEQKKRLDLSHCKDIEIKIIYDIRNQSLLNQAMISYYSDLGIDIFNSNDSFFHDICYPFAISKSDIILKDRVSDIYQNFSLCDNGCEYNEIDMDNLSVTCSCQVKAEIETKVLQPAFGKIIKSTFADSNFGVIKCYKLVFRFESKFQNMGFLVSLVFFLAHIVCFIYFIITGVKSIVIFVIKEMHKNNYITKINNPKKKNNYKCQKDDNSNSKNEFNSAILMNLEKILKKQNLKNIKQNQKKEKEKRNKKGKQKEKKGKQKVKKEKEKRNKKGNDKKKVDKKGEEKGKRNSQPIFIFNYKYDNNYYKVNNRTINSKKTLKNYSKMNIKTIKQNSSKIYSIRKLNKENKFPGYYNLIQINANNSLKNKPPYSKFILDNYNFEEAIKYETRDFWRIYFIILLSKENILNTFFFKSPIESQPIRISIFIFNYSCDFALNALFYFNEKISDKYHYEGDSIYLFILINNMTISIFSNVVSYLLVKSLNQLTNSKEAIELLFREEEKRMRKNKDYRVDKNRKIYIFRNLLKVFKIMKIKIICYIIIEMLLMLFFIYFITAFCEVYSDTQMSLLFDSLISFILSIPIELLISFIISIMYLTAIKLKLKCLYNMVLFLYSLG